MHAIRHGSVSTARERSLLFNVTQLSLDFFPAYSFHPIRRHLLILFGPFPAPPYSHSPFVASGLWVRHRRYLDGVFHHGQSVSLSLSWGRSSPARMRCLFDPLLRIDIYDFLSCRLARHVVYSVLASPPLPFFLYTPRLCPLSSHPLPLTPASVALTTKKGVCHITVPCSVFLSVSSTRLVDRYSLALLALPRHPNSLTRIPHLVTYPFDYRAW